MNEEEIKAIQNLRLNVTNVGFSIYDGTTCMFKATDMQTILNLIEKQQAEIEKQNKIIDKMAGNVFLMNGDRGCTKQEIIEYFTKLVEEEN